MHLRAVGLRIYNNYKFVHAIEAIQIALSHFIIKLTTLIELGISIFPLIIIH